MTGKPAPFGAYTTPEFWDDPHISAQMLAFHLDPEAAPASRPHAFIDASAAWIAREFALGDGSRVLDLGCGPGLYAQRLAASGAAVVGVDVSARSLAHARATAAERALPATFVQGSYLDDDVDLGSGHDLAIMIYEDYCALSPAQRTGLLRRVHAALRPGGAVLVDVTAAARFASLVEEHVTEPDLQGGFWAPSPYVGTLDRWRYDDLRLAVDHYAIAKDGEVREFWNWIHCLTPDEVAAEAASAGFVVERVLGDVAGAPYDETAPTFAVVLRRDPVPDPAPADDEAASLDDAAATLRATGATGWDLVEAARLTVRHRFATYSVLHFWESPATAFARRRGYCAQYNGALAALLTSLGVECRLVHSRHVELVDDPTWHMGHVWVRARIDGDVRDVCASSPQRDRLRFRPVSPVRRFGRATYFGTSLGMAVLVPWTRARAALTRTPPPAWLDRPFAT